MMTREEFYENVKEKIFGYLPEKFEDADIRLCSNVKNNDIVETGIAIRLPGEIITPVIYLEDYFQQYQNGENMGDILMAIGNARGQLMDTRDMEIDAESLTDYEKVKGNLQMRVFDTEKNEKRLEGLVHHSFGDYSSAYAILLSDDPETSMSVMVTPDMMERWGITKRQLHEDTIQADMSRGPILMDMESTMSSLMGGMEPQNYLEKPIPEEVLFKGEDGPPPFFCLTNRERMNGAGLILNPQVQEKLANELGNYYVLPSSIHEVLILADVGDRELFNAKGLEEMVKSINESTVAPKEVLSDKVEYYDASARMLVNAVEYERKTDLIPDQLRSRTL